MIENMEIQVLTKFKLRITLVGQAIAKKDILPQTWPYMDLLRPKWCPKYPNSNESRNCQRYTMEIHIPIEFHLKMTVIGGDTSKKIIFPNWIHIWIFFRPNFVQYSQV